MKNRYWGLPLVGLAVSWLCAFDLSARPRPPLPPLPELVPLLSRTDFDEAFWARTEKSESLHPAYTDLVEGWSGYALKRAGVAVTPFLVPALDATGKTNIGAPAGAVRFWFKPYWSSTTVPMGTGPGVNGRLAELTAVDPTDSVYVWSLDVSADGTALFLTGATDTGAGLLFAAPINWQAGQWHLLALNYGPKGTTLFIDGLLAGEGDGVLSVPPMRFGALGPPM